MNRLELAAQSRYAGMAAVIIRLLLGAVFIHAGVSKIMEPRDFADAVANYQLLPNSLVNIFSITLPWIELLCGLSLVTGVLLTSGALLTSFLNAVFIAAAVVTIARGLDIECGCQTLAAAGEKLGWNLVIRDSTFLVMAVLVTVQASLRSHRPQLRTG